MQTKQYYIYILPSCPTVDKIWQVKGRELLGVFVDMFETNNKVYDIGSLTGDNIKIQEKNN